ncbi:MAG: hypothetical protein BHW46_00740 [Roseburia intestinalis]|nr:MAG: hypothetical protein BHW46_00740 [Roseburia intestinalis]
MKSLTHFKETEKGREHMGDVVEKYANEKALCATIKNVKSLMENMKISVEQALNVLDIQGESRAIISKQLQK